MKTIEQIKADILATNPSRIYEINGEQFEQTDAEFNDAVNKRAQMEYEQLLKIAQIQTAKAIATAKLEALGLDIDDLNALGL